MRYDSGRWVFPPFHPILSENRNCRQDPNVSWYPTGSHGEIPRDPSGTPLPQDPTAPGGISHATPPSPAGPIPRVLTGLTPPGSPARYLLNFLMSRGTYPAGFHGTYPACKVPRVTACSRLKCLISRGMYPTGCHGTYPACKVPRVTACSRLKCLMSREPQRDPARTNKFPADVSWIPVGFPRVSELP